MATTTIGWGDGSGDNLYLTYPSASGNQTISVTSDANGGAARSKVVSFSATGVSPVSLTISQAAGQITPNHPCLTFKSTGSNTLSMECNGTASPTLYYSTDGTTWTLWDYSALPISDGHPVFIYGNNTSGFNSSTSNYARFVIGGDSNVTCQGNIMVLIAGTETRTTIPANYYFARIFRNNTKLISAPSFPATTLKNYCYYQAFSGCTGLTSAPTLPATTLTRSCYDGMFYGCSSLTSAPQLNATTMQRQCYYQMFRGCSNLETAPDLPATTLAQDCYSQMFYQCGKLNYVKALFTTTPGSGYTTNWLYGVASTGTFVKNSAATWTNTGVSSVPSGWTVQTASS